MQTTLESLVCTKEQSQALLTKHKPKTLFMWYNRMDAYGELWYLDENLGGGIPAFTAPELLSEINPTRWERLWLAYKTAMEPQLLAKYLIKRRGL